jgi:hypothetical protein
VTESGARSTAAPKAGAGRSVWSRLGAGSRTVVVPRRGAPPAARPS